MAAAAPAPAPAPAPRVLRILHFNDVYNLQQRDRDPCGGATRMQWLLEQRQAAAAAAGADLLTLFSGDAFYPSMMSTVFRGKHMVPVLNKMGIQASCLGNHDLDGGMDVLADRLASCTFPWVCSNCVDRETGRPLGDCMESLVLTSGSGIRVGIVGLVEAAWVDTLSMLDADDVIVEDPAVCVKRLAPALRSEGADLVVALCHMRLNNDVQLAREAAGVVDLILGGHDHDPAVRVVSGVLVAKAGTEWQRLHEVEVCVDDRRALADVPAALAADASSLADAGVDPKRIPVGEGDASVFAGWLEPLHEKCEGTPDAAPALTAPLVRLRAFPTLRAMPEEPEMVGIVHEFVGKLAPRMARIVGETSVTLDARFRTVRRFEANIGNLVTDLMREALHADVAILNGGTIRADDTIAPGPVRMQDVVRLLPMQDPVVKLRITSTDLLAVLENAVSKWPALEGRFAQVSGIRFAFDGRKPPGERVLPRSVRVNSRWLMATGPEQRAAPSPAAAVVAAAAEASAAQPPRPPSGSAAATGGAAAPGGEGRGLAEPVGFSAAGLGVGLESVGGDTPGRLGDTTPEADAPVYARDAAGQVIRLALLFEHETHPRWREATWTVATKAYLADGHDGYTAFKRGEVLVDDEQGPVIPHLLRRHLSVLAALNGFGRGIRHFTVERVAMTWLDKWRRRGVVMAAKARTSAKKLARTHSAGVAQDAARAMAEIETVVESGGADVPQRVLLRRTHSDRRITEAAADAPVAPGCTHPFVLRPSIEARILQVVDE